jgi:hypothetical protein
MWRVKGEYWYRFVWWMYCKASPTMTRVVRDSVARLPFQKPNQLAKVLSWRTLTPAEMEQLFFDEGTPEMRKAMMEHAAAYGHGSDNDMRMAMSVRKRRRLVWGKRDR